MGGRSRRRESEWEKQNGVRRTEYGVSSAVVVRIVVGGSGRNHGEKRDSTSAGLHPASRVLRKEVTVLILCIVIQPFFGVCFSAPSPSS